jgi:hypothetical protein
VLSKIKVALQEAVSRAIAPSPCSGRADASDSLGKHKTGIYVAFLLLQSLLLLQSPGIPAGSSTP